ncbi:MAG: hypothetical protein HY902_08705 [Deltaproteobacteria bacterium]|nr:hypothetical protein [Deltaproteobacteria bacterium]
MRLPLRSPLRTSLATPLLLALMAVAAVPALGSSPANALSPQALAPLAQAAQRQAAELQRRYPAAELSWSEAMLGPVAITGLQIDVAGDNVERKALEFAKLHAALWGIRGDDLRLWHTTRSRDRNSVRLNLTVPSNAGELIVLDRVLVVTFDGAGRLITVTSDLVPLGAAQVGPISQAEARQIATKAVFAGRESQVTSAGSARLAAVASLQTTQVVWAVDVVASRAIERYAVLVDSQTGAVLSKRPVAIH